MMLQYDEEAIKTGQIEDTLFGIEEKFRIIADSTPIAVMLHQDDCWIYVNRAAETITGYPANELLGKVFWDIAHPDYKALLRERARRNNRGKPQQTVMSSRSFRNAALKNGWT
jgi:PAS domain S-box-containing protein